MKKMTLLFVLFFSVLELRAQSFEGYIANTYPIWVDLTIPVSDGEVTGAYFYKQYGGSITLSGTKMGNSINLIEKDSKQKVTGIFACTNFGDSITGAWRKKKGRDSLMVRLYKTDPMYKKFAKIPTTDKLILANGSSLKSMLHNIENPDESGLAHCEISKVKFIFAQKNIIGIWFDWMCAGVAHGGGFEERIFDLTSYKEIVVWKEVDPNQEAAFNKYLCQKVQSELNQWRNRYPDSEWVKVFRGVNIDDDDWGYKKKPLNECFIVSDLKHYPFPPLSERGTLFYIENNNLHFVIASYFNFPPVISDRDFFCDISIPPKELENYLKPTSILRNLAKTP
jgi:hypothetical protein